MPALSSYLDFVKATKVHRISRPKDILQEAVKNTYFMKEMHRGAPAAKIVRGAQAFKDEVKLSNTGTFQFYTPNTSLSPVDRDTLKTIQISKRYALTHYGWNDEAMEENQGADPEDYWIDYKRSKTIDAETDQWNGMETALWAVPDYTSMESGSGDSPPAYSIPTLVNEYTNGVPTGWTGSVIQNIDASLESRWVPQQVSYNFNTPFDEAAGIIAAFDKMWRLVKFESPPSSKDYFENDNLATQKIVTHGGGYDIYRRALRGSNENLIDKQDPAYGAPKYAGIPLYWASELDTAALDLANSAAWPATKPRYLWLNLKYLHPIYDGSHYMRQQDPQNGAMGTPFSWVVYFKTWYNIFCRSRQRQGIVYPA